MHGKARLELSVFALDFAKKFTMVRTGHGEESRSIASEFDRIYEHVLQYIAEGDHSEA